MAGSSAGGIDASCSTGTVTTTGANRGGFVGYSTGTIANSYWDTVTTSIADDNDDNAPEGETSNKLKSVTSYMDIYANWNADADGASGNDALWDFGTTSQFTPR